MTDTSLGGHHALVTGAEAASAPRPRLLSLGLARA